MRKIIFILLLLLIFQDIFSQKYSSTSIKAIRKFEDAMSFFNMRRLDEAIPVFEAAIKEDGKFIEAYLMLADVYNMKRNYVKEAETYKQVEKIDTVFFNRLYLNLANALLLTAKYDEALLYCNKFISKSDLSSANKADAEFMKKKCEFSIEAIKNPVPFQPVNLGDSINSEADEYWPYLTADDEVLLFTRDITKGKVDMSFMRVGQEELFISKKVNDKWTKAKSVGPPINTSHNEGASCLSADGQYLIFTASGRIEGEGDCDIYITKKSGRVWGKPVGLGAPVNTGKWESTPSLSADGKTLYFSSTRKGGKGKMDIWVATLSKSGGFNPPVNLGDSINTPGDEFAPFIHPDGKTLYFSSNGHIGMGGHDIYMSRKDSTGKWSKPMNLGYPINTHNDEIGLIVNAKGDLAMFSSDRLGGKGCDIYTFDLYEKIKPVITTYVKGTVFNASDFKQKLKAKLVLIDLETQKTVEELYSADGTGAYMICLPVDKNYAFNASKEGFMFYSENFSLKDMKDPTKPYVMDIMLQPIKIDNKVVLKNIFYEFNSFELKHESTAELDKLIDFMKSNPSVKIEISGHTDNVGTKAYNQKLSEDRAKSVYTYLMNHTIAKERLSFKGYDFSQPIDTNDTEEGRAKNRRTEFKIVGL